MARHLWLPSGHVFALDESPRIATRKGLIIPDLRYHEVGDSACAWQRQPFNPSRWLLNVGMVGT